MGPGPCVSLTYRVSGSLIISASTASWKLASTITPPMMNCIGAINSSISKKYYYVKGSDMPFITLNQKWSISPTLLCEWRKYQDSQLRTWLVTVKLDLEFMSGPYLCNVCQFTMNDWTSWELMLPIIKHGVQQSKMLSIQYVEPE